MGRIGHSGINLKPGEEMHSTNHAPLRTTRNLALGGLLYRGRGRGRFVYKVGQYIGVFRRVVLSEIKHASVLCMYVYLRFSFLFVSV